MATGFIIRFFRHSRWKTPAVWLLLCTFLLPLTGVPLPTVSQSTKDNSVPFPCQHRACGCRDAQSCWKNCCCHTNAQKVSWARKHAVTLPDYVIVAAKQERKKLVAATCCSQVHATSSVKPRSNRRDERVSTERRLSKAQPKGQMYANMEAFQKCKGLANYILLLSQALACEENAIPLPEVQAQSYLSVISDSAKSENSEPPSPPPRGRV